MIRRIVRSTAATSCLLLYDFIGDTKTVDVHIRWLREKVEDEPSSPQLIRTVRGFGYRFG